MQATTEKKVFIVNNHDSFTYNLVELFRRLKVDFLVCDVEKINFSEVEDFSHILISPGPDVPSVYPNLFKLFERFYQHKSILGVCLGHQSLWQFFGGELMQLPAPRHGEQKTLHQVKKSALFHSLPENFAVGLYHSWAVKTHPAPKNCQILAYCEDEIVMAFQHSSLPIFGIQFHPESFMSEYGLELIAHWLGITVDITRAKPASN